MKLSTFNYILIKENGDTSRLSQTVMGQKKLTEPQGVIIRQATVRLGHNPLRGT